MTHRKNRLEALSPAKLALLERRLSLAQAGGASRERPHAIPRRRASGPAPLSFPQERLWFLDQLQPGGTAYHFPCCIPLQGPLDKAALEWSLLELARRHETLRTTFQSQGGVPVQVVSPTPSLPLAVIHRAPLSGAARDQVLTQLLAEEVKKPFNLSQGPLVRAMLVRFQPEDHVLLLTLHHIVSDGWSMEVLTRELDALYRARLQGQPSPLAELPIQYADYAVWQRQSLSGTALQSSLAYWRQQLQGAPAVLELPADRRRPTVQSYRGAICSFELPARLSESLRGLALQEGAVSFMVLLAAFKVLLHRYTGETDIAIGTPVANRSRTELEGLIGFFVNMLVLRTDMGGDPTFREWLGRVRKAALGAYSHQELPFEKLVEELRPERNLSHHPLFQVMFTFQAASQGSASASQGPVPGLEAVHATSKFDLSLAMAETPQGLRGSFEYSTDLFDRDRIERMARHFETLLEGIVANPDCRLSDLPLLRPAEQEALLYRWNDTRAAYPEELLVHQLFERQAERTPQAPAVVFEGRTLSYRELDQAANCVASQLRACGVGPESIVGVYLERSLEMMAGILGILKAGGAWLPLDPTYPARRLESMLADARAQVVLTLPGTRARLPGFKARVLEIEDVTGQATAPTSPPAPELSLELSLDHPAYVIFTSGSTGTPKGVVIPHRGILNRLQWMQEAYALTARDRVVQKTPLSFDVSVWELLWPLMYGATLVIARPEGHKDSTYLVDLFLREQVTVAHFVPSMLRVFLEDPRAGECCSLRAVICSGEALPLDTQERFFKLLEARLHNLYGPTEASVDVTAWTCRPQEERDSVPIGHPIANTSIYLLDSHLRPVPMGIPGELYIGGVGLARGYLARPELTAERFLPDPFSRQPGARMYRTGDRASRRPDGAIEFLGRLDHQIKLRGFRIEPGEVESALREHPAVRDVCALVREDRPGDQRLVAYIVADPAAPAPGRRELTELLRQRLPEHMLPGAYVLLEALPKTRSGKLDRRALPPPTPTRPELEHAPTAPRGPIEQMLVEIWKEVLRVEQVGVEDDFFELGGHSLLATQVISRVRERLGAELPLRLFFERPTVRTLAEQVKKAPAGNGSPAPPLSHAQAQALLERLATLSAAEVEGALSQLVAGYPPSVAPPTPEAASPPAAGQENLWQQLREGYLRLTQTLQEASQALLSQRHAARLECLRQTLEVGAAREAAEARWKEIQAETLKAYHGACAGAYLGFLQAHRQAWQQSDLSAMEGPDLRAVAELLLAAASEAGTAFTTESWG